ncbi:hypothetical protein COV56_02555 [Candidatus Kuenenbacteria bacterium CG11_big_fil_rev_8_21_14_0_20_37_9]|uniref:DUF2304 domain-containing protein n=2 Tax=Candidatus Kueneniibacteriota TaxID=1752740 RepID=A0A2M6XS44_9BACT|nr:MAG: hypothetical protein AUJ29_00920 [Candidatus Kuenenbacteria bacterium CG1_02_38_13]PIR05479.1 MAG: hypothetical protein COV56_02555 [Candidatus Kuenenbacteria bacterium CG11_big_fil_rev_8_21_14_0_20_37_9]PIU10421.1 MAG: DUF2304 domain-containing protein [Candidatus Kuenenbacteria bacterium CG08_land_8_20_14_0_20_37_23]
MSLIQILALVFCLFALWRVILKFRRQELKITEFFMWLIFWLAVGVAFVTPESLTRLANVLGIGRGADLVLYVAVVVVFYLMFRIFVRLENMERNITKIVRKDALKDKDSQNE